MTDAPRTTDRKYNILGTATKISIVESGSGRFARLTINRGAKGTLAAKLNDKALAKFEAAGFGEGSSVDFYGFYDKNTWTGNDGKLRTTDLFRVISVAVPLTAEQIAERKAAKAARTGGETVSEIPAAAPVAIGDDEIPF